MSEATNGTDPTFDDRIEPFDVRGQVWEIRALYNLGRGIALFIATRSWIPHDLKPIVAVTLLRAVIAVIFFAPFVVLLGAYLDARLFPILRWPQALLFVHFGWALARFFPSVWENRTDDKFPIVFVALMILLCAWNAWSLVAG